MNPKVHALEPLLSSERFELACNASGLGTGGLTQAIQAILNIFSYGYKS